MNRRKQVQVILIEADLLNDIRTENTLHIPTIEVLTEQTNELIVTSDMTPDIGPIIRQLQKTQSNKN